MDALPLGARLRRQRNIATACAAGTLGMLLAIGLPRAVSRHNRLKAVNAELLRLQADIVERQARIRNWQRDIRTHEAEIGTLREGRHP